MLPLADGARPGRLDARDEERRLGVAEPERRQSVELLGELERQRARRNDRVDGRERPEVDASELGVRMTPECVGERLQLLGLDREPGRGAVASEPPEMRRARGEPGVEVEVRDRAARSLPALAASRDEHHGPMEALDEARRDDPDHSFVPALVPQDVAPALSLRGGPRLDARDRLPQDPLLHALTLSVQLLELAGELAGLRPIVGQEQLEREVGSPEPARGVDARGEPEPDGGRVDGRRIDARRLHERLEARAGSFARAPAAPRRPARGSRRRAGRRRRSSPARRGRAHGRSPGGRRRGARGRACARRPCRRARGTGMRTGASPRSGSREAPPPVGGGP